MKYCIFCCVFTQEKYVEMFYLLLESINIYGNLGDNIDVLVYTSTSFMNMIKQSHLFNDEKVKFEINDTYSSLDSARNARLELFNLQSTCKYNKILYLENDVLVKDDIHKVFNVCKEDILYVLEKGETNSNSAFTSGIVLFNNCEKIKNMFQRSHEQHEYNNTILKSLAVNNDNNIYSDNVIHHFSNVNQDKAVVMTNFLNSIKEITYNNLNQTMHIENDLWTCSAKMRTDIADFFVSKQNFKIAEIGSHKGYSTKVLAKIFSKVYAVDNSVEWTGFNKNFNKDSTNIEYVMLDIYKDSWNVLPDDIEVSFIDADHSYNGCKSDIINSINRFKNLKYIIFDDYGVWSGVKQSVDEFIENKTLTFKRFIGTTDVPGPNGIVTNVNEGIICAVSKNQN